MRRSARWAGLSIVSGGLALALGTGAAAAQDVEPDVNDADDSDLAPVGASPTADGAAQDALEAEPAVSWGVGPRLRYVFEPRGLIELFFEEVPGGMAHPGFGLEVVRRHGDFEIALGLEIENLSPPDGFYREKGGGDVSSKTDFTEFDGFGWVTIDAAFIFHRPLTDLIALRYGAGFGLGIIRGEILQTDSICTSENIQDDCVRNDNSPDQVNEPADLPPVFPVVSLLGGVQFRPTPDITINLEAGLRTVFYAGLAGTYFF